MAKKLLGTSFTAPGLGQAVVDGMVGGAIAGGLTGLLLPEP